MNLWLIFLTGLTTGGLTCLAVQGGLLATAMTRQVTIPAATPQERRAKGKTRSKVVVDSMTGVHLSRDPWPVVYFLVAKLFAYTGLGFLLGWLGSAVQITPAVQAAMQIVAGVFLLATALNMLNVHPIFRYFVIQPPKVLTRLVRDQAKSEKLFAPALLGLMTVFIPCGTTQAMMVLAVSSGNPLWGALILFTFVLGTSPTFFVLGFLVTRLRGKVQQAFTVITTILILFLGLLAINAGLRVAGSPLAPSTLLTSLMNPQLESSGATVAADGVQEITINVLDRGYVPNILNVESDKPIRLKLVTNNTYGCARAFTIPSLGISRVLPERGEEVISLPAQPVGRIYFTCSMGMYGGVINVNG